MVTDVDANAIMEITGDSKPKIMVLNSYMSILYCRLEFGST